MISSRIYILTLKGFFSVWSLQTYDVVFQKNYFKNAKSLISFRLTNKVMLIFENEIYVLDSNPNYNTFDELPSYTLKLNQISDAKLNHNEKILGVATTSAAAPEVTLYDTENGFSKMKTLYGFKSSIKYIDFSTDNYYLQCEDNLGEVLLFEIETQRIIHTDAVDFELEWLGEGLRSYSQLKGIHYWYSQSNKITQICKVIGRPIVAVGDELGTIRLFNYPNTTGEGYYQCYSDHQFAITSCLFSYDRRYFLSTSEIDRCIFKWKVVYNTDKIKKLIQEHMGV
jgi:WD40 repeat protein